MPEVGKLEETITEVGKAEEKTPEIRKLEEMMAEIGKLEKTMTEIGKPEKTPEIEILPVELPTPIRCPEPVPELVPVGPSDLTVSIDKFCREIFLYYTRSV